MSGIFEKPSGKRWPRAQRFQLSPTGIEAEASYRETLVAAKTAQGREAFDALRGAWAAKRAVQPNDGLFLSELQASPRTLVELVRSLDSCGTTRDEVHSAVDRLTTAGLVEACVVAEPPPRPPMNRW